MPKGCPHVSSNIVWQLPELRARTFEPKAFLWAKIMKRNNKGKATAVEIPTGFAENEKGAKAFARPRARVAVNSQPALKPTVWNTGHRRF
jgi:hypothetical protein